MIERHRRGGVLQDVRTLFDSGTTVGLSDGELLGRFADRPGGDDAAGPAFEALVERHGPMVLRVCRSILRDEHDAQDAFQATFLVLVRRAVAMRRQESVGSWLHGVALRVSARARVEMARRCRHERRSVEARGPADRTVEAGLAPEAVGILHEELGRLPEPYRAAVVLCYLEGHTCEAAASRLGWPVGTVKSRLARGRERLRGRLIRRGLAPDEASESPTAPAVLIPAALARTTAEAMLRFAAGGPAVGAVSATALSWTRRTLRTMQMTRLSMIVTLLIVGLAATGAAMRITQAPGPLPSRPVVPAKRAAQEREPVKPASPEKKVEMLSVRAVDTRSRGVPDVEVKVVESDAKPAGDGPGYRIAVYRTGADGRVRIAVDPQFNRLAFEARPHDRTIGWASLQSDQARPKATDDDPITLTLLSRNHQVEGTIVDTRGQPIRGVRVRVEQFNHHANGFASDSRGNDQESPLGSSVTDEAGRYRFILPEDTTAHLSAYHPRFVGPSFSCKPDDRTIPPVTFEDAGGIAGTVVDATTGRPVAGAQIGAQRIEHGGRILGGGWGSATSDAQGHFLVGGLQPGVFNLLFGSSPKGRRFTAQAVEGVRVKAGEEARADLRMVEGQRVRGTAVSARTGKPLIGVPIFCYSSSHPRSGAACQGTYTDEQARFEHFIPPGPALVYIAQPGQFGREFRRVLDVPADRDPDPVVLKQGDDPNTKEPPGMDPPVECGVRVRVKTDAGDRPAPGSERTLTGRVFDKGGSMLIGVQVVHATTTFHEAATDRLGIFRLGGLPAGRLRLEVHWDGGERRGRVIVPAEAVEVDLIIP